MALVKCPECGRENVSHSAVACPACGFGIKNYFDKIKIDNKVRKSVENNNKLITPIKPEKDNSNYGMGYLFIFFGMILMSAGIVAVISNSESPLAIFVFLAFILFTIIGIYYLSKGREQYESAMEEYNKAVANPDIYKQAVIENEKQKIYSSSTQYIPKCPTCGSDNVEKISLSSKAVGGFMFGLFSSNVRKTMRCNSCGYKW